MLLTLSNQMLRLETIVPLMVSYNADSLCYLYIYLPSRKVRQLIFMPKLPSICICVYMYLTVSYGQLACGLEIVWLFLWPVVAAYNLYNILNSRFRLLPILRCTYGDQFGDRLRPGQCAIFCPWSPSKSLRSTRMLGKITSVT